jgi:hypothetical protein
MVIIGVGEGYRSAGMVAMWMGCAEVERAVENLWNVEIMAGMGGLWGQACGKLLFRFDFFAWCST